MRIRRRRVSKQPRGRSRAGPEKDEGCLSGSRKSESTRYPTASRVRSRHSGSRSRQEPRAASPGYRRRRAVRGRSRFRRARRDLQLPLITRGNTIWNFSVGSECATDWKRELVYDWHVVLSCLPRISGGAILSALADTLFRESRLDLIHE